MKIKSFFLSTIAASLLLAINANAVSVNFVEGGPGVNVAVTPSGFFIGAVPAQTTTGPFSASFTDDISGDLGSGSYSIGLLNSPGGTLADYVTVKWASGLYINIFITQFDFVFKSADGVNPFIAPGAFNITAVEDGTLQTFSIPVTGAQLTVGVRAYRETRSVPDSGATLLLLSCGVLGLGAFRRFQVV